MTAEKSFPGFAVPDSVHHVKLVSPRKLPLRCTVTCADGSSTGTSTVSAANSIFAAPARAASADAADAADAADVPGGKAGASAGEAVRDKGGETAGEAARAKGGEAADDAAVGGGVAAATATSREAG